MDEALSCSSSSVAFIMFLIDLNLFNKFFARVGPTLGRASIKYSCCCFLVNDFLFANKLITREGFSNLFAMIAKSDAVSLKFFVWRIGIWKSIAMAANIPLIALG